MKANELMVGDWVDLSEEPNEMIPCQVVGIMPEELYEIQPNDTACDIIGYDMIRPIPLTPEILEKNGWDGINAYRQYGHASGVFNDDYQCEIGLYEDGRCFLVINDGEYSIYEINGVHELQHALRLCGLNDFADNFKV